MAVPGALATTVELKLEVQNIPALDTFSLSDPQVILYNVDGRGKIEIGRTEVAKNKTTHKFVTGITMQYFFEKEQRLQFDIWDVDPGSKNDFIGEVACTLGQIMGAPGQKLALKIKQHPAAKLIIRSETLQSSNAYVHFTMAAEGLDKKDFLGKSDPFVTISRQNQDKTWSPIHKTEYIYQNLNPTWKPFMLTTLQLCNSEKGRPIKFEVFDWDSDGSSDFIGHCEVKLEELEELATKNAAKKVSLINPKKTSKKSYVNSGVLVFKQVRVEPVYSFLDYVAGGLELQFVVAVDFTGSNGNPRDPKSLHFQGNPGGRNAYADAIWAVGNIVQHYDADKLFPAFGFGAKMGGQVHYNFALNFNPSNPYCGGIEGILGAYRQAINNPGVELWGPTNFAPVINSVTQLAQQAVASGRQQYTVLMILTDGVISDLEQTKTAIVEISKLPVSIIIIGVGNEDFSAMNVLDSDDRLLRDAQGRTAERDIVQFVPMRNFQNNPEGLAAEVLKEVPAQVTSYYRQRNIKPLPARHPLTPTPTSPSLYGAPTGASLHHVQSGGVPPMGGNQLQHAPSQGYTNYQYPPAGSPMATSPMPTSPYGGSPAAPGTFQYPGQAPPQVQVYPPNTAPAPAGYNPGYPPAGAPAPPAPYGQPGMPGVPNSGPTPYPPQGPPTPYMPAGQAAAPYPPQQPGAYPPGRPQAPPPSYGGGYNPSR